MHRFCKGALVEHRAIEPVEFGAGLAFDIGAPEVDDSMRAARRLQSRQPLAHEHCHRVFERRLVAVSGLGEGALVIPVVEHRGEIRGDAFHPPRPDRLDPRLLDRVEQRARRLVLRGMAAMDRVVVAGEPQRHGIGEPAQDRGLARIGLARRLRQARLGAVRADDQRRLVGGEQNFQLGAPGHRARARGERPLEQLVGRLGLGAGLAVAHRFDVDGGHSRVLS